MHKCENGKITICEDASKRAGLSSTFYFECTACKHRVDRDTSKNVEGKACSFDVNRRTNFAMSADHDSGNANCSWVNKLDCVGDVQKHMGKNLIGLTGWTKLADGKPVGGKSGRLTRPTIDKLQKYYGNAIRCCTDKKAKTKQDIDNAVKKMQCAIKAVLYHSVKINNDKNRHQYCPEGKSSWCSYQRGKDDGDVFINKPHHLDPVFLGFLTPLLDRLSDKKLLNR